MPRRNNRKRYKGEGTLGFNPYKYISGSGYGSCYGFNSGNGSVRTFGRSGIGRAGSISPDVQRIARADKPCSDRHKAHSYTQKKRRAMNEIRQMSKSAEKVCASLSVPKSSPKPAEGAFPAPANSPEPAAILLAVHETVDDSTVKPTNTIFGGIKEWLKRKARLV